MYLRSISLGCTFKRCDVHKCINDMYGRYIKLQLLLYTCDGFQSALIVINMFTYKYVKDIHIVESISLEFL